MAFVQFTLIQDRLNPVPVGQYGLFAVVTDNQGRNTTEIAKRMVVDSDPLWFPGGQHSFRIDILGIRQDGK